jgi:hypothetical protein
MIIKPIEIDFKKYKRFFTFGCSFTSYMWPTWSEVLSQEMPNAESYNFGHCGGGNSMMVTRIAEANSRFKFNNTDLIIPMWTTFCREDRFRHGAWMSVGNIYSQAEYSEEFVRNYADPKGYLLRDLSFIELATKYLSTLQSDCITLASVPYDYQMDMKDHLWPAVSEILEVYKEILSVTPTALVDLELDGCFKHGHSYRRADNGTMYDDYHPNTLNYCSYLQKIGIPLTNLSIDYTEKSMELLTSTETEKQIYAVFDPMITARRLKLKHMF